MKTWHCTDCDTDFQSERSTACLHCGSTDVTCPGEIASEKPPGPHSDPIPGETGPLPAEDIRNILKELCVVAYESPYNGFEWDKAIQRAIEKLEPYLNTAARQVGGYKTKTT